MVQYSQIKDNRLINGKCWINNIYLFISRALDTQRKCLTEENMKTDRRVKYTQKVLKESLLEILKERPIERVTVKEICDRADINRSTFYVHYGSPQELFDSIKLDLFHEIKEKKRDYSDIKSYMNEICDIIYENRELFLVMIGAGHIEAMFALSDLWKDDFMDNLPEWADHARNLSLRFCTSPAAHSP